MLVSLSYGFKSGNCGVPPGDHVILANRELGKAWFILMPESVGESKVGITLECPLGTVSNNKTRLNAPHRTAVTIYH